MASLLIAVSLASVPTSATAQGTVSVSIKNFAFSPNTITVVIGVNNTVTWTNMDSVPHTVTANGGAFDSGDLASGQTFTRTFTSAGTFAYRCSIHTYMTGTVVVEASGSTSSTTSQNSSSSSTGGIPEFPFGTAAVVATVAVVLASYLVMRRPRRG